jgi:hypothetical protein
VSRRAPAILNVRYASNLPVPGLGREGLEAAHQRHTVDQPGASAVVRRRDEAIDLDGERVRGLDRCRVVLFAGDLQANRQIPLDKADRSAVAAR